MPVSNEQHAQIVAEFAEQLAAEAAAPAAPGPPVCERCAFCSFEVEAPLEEARTAFAAHACERPRPGQSSP